MFSPANQPQFTLTLAGADFQVLSFKGTETLNAPFAFELELVSERAFLDLEKLLHQQAFLQLSSSGTGTGIHGLVYSIAQGEAGRRLTRYSLSLRPQLAYLDHRINQRIFQQMTVRKIIAQVLEEHGILASDYRFQLGATYPERVYCVQYDESDLHFIRRLCEEEGIHFHFQHSPEGHLLVFGDDQTVFPKLAPVAYQQDTGLVADVPVIKRFGLRLATRTSRVTSAITTSPNRASSCKVTPRARCFPTWKITTIRAVSLTVNAASTWPPAAWNATAAITDWPKARAISLCWSAAILCR